MEITAEMIDKAIIESLQDFKADEELFSKYLSQIESDVDNRDKKIKEERSKLQLQYNNIESKRKKYISENSIMLTL
ncbi:hypothetical protein IJS64_03850 [bacterium]|nr:hypothetical protein [bacterium]MBR6099830.1 hypothetical protein [bacterium]